MSDPLRDDLPPDELKSPYPLSPMQQGMLFHRLFSWSSGVDVEQIVCTLEEPLGLRSCGSPGRDSRSAGGTPLFETLLVFERDQLNTVRGDRQ
jgi:hypothetical protein